MALIARPTQQEPYIGGIRGKNAQLAINCDRGHISYVMRHPGHQARLDVVAPYAFIASHDGRDPSRTNETSQHGIVSSIASAEHFDRIGHAITFALIDPSLRRTMQRDAYGLLLGRLAGSELTLPVGVMSGPRGGIEQALHDVRVVERVRKRWSESGAAPAVLIYGGDPSQQDPNAWLEASRAIIERQEGRVILDLTRWTGRQRQDQVETLESTGYAWIGNAVLADSI